MSLEIEVPVAFTGDVLNDLTVKRRAQVKEVLSAQQQQQLQQTSNHNQIQNNHQHDSSTGNSTIHAEVPLATMLGYATAIRSMTQGEGVFSMEYTHHQPVV